MIQQPVAIGLTLCEQVIIEEGSRNVTLVNCFRYRKVREFPSPPQRLVIYALLTDGLGSGTVKVTVAPLDTLEAIYIGERTMAFTNPLQEFAVMFRPRSLSFPAAGHYQATLLVDGELVTQRSFRVTAMGEPS